ncbi:hypothetical protein VSDG_03352 [Cytospora chrysosperma]|uniref:Uncharacterized protein n=1 Tax=Cytospora chrysosperma TaxID=252740 RepID=A0A423WBB8_CYTCH|nr:hypothetical protein VSDG_03352 [Valsa sordida]
MTSFETTRTYSSHSASSAGDDSQATRLSNNLNPRTGRPLRNVTPYGRHSNDWLFGSVAVKESIRRGVKKVFLAVGSPGHVPPQSKRAIAQ